MRIAEKERGGGEEEGSKGTQAIQRIDYFVYTEEKDDGKGLNRRKLKRKSCCEE